MVVDGKLVIEIKSTYVLPVAAERQVYNYLRGSGLRVGLLLHFGPTPRFHRMICNTKAQYPANPLDPQHPA
jgi:GxxExxY protein